MQNFCTSVVDVSTGETLTSLPNTGHRVCGKGKTHVKNVHSSLLEHVSVLCLNSICGGKCFKTPPMQR